MAARPRLLCLAHSFPPDPAPGAIQAGRLLAGLDPAWDVTVLSATPGPARRERARVEVVSGHRPERLLAAIRRLRLDKLIDLLVWPDDSIFWLPAAFLRARRLIEETAPDAIVVFMMPYACGLVGVALSKLTGIPLVFKLDDSPTCTDMHPSHPSRLHYLLARKLEDFYVRQADASVYVSATNMEAVRSRQPDAVGERTRLVRCGADPAAAPTAPRRTADFEITYTGGMTGWRTLIEERARPGRMRRLYRAWTGLGRYERYPLDPRTHSPAVIGRAIKAAIAEHPEWAGRVRLRIVGDRTAAPVVARALRAAGVDDVVSLADPVAHDEVAAVAAAADLLFITLPNRPDGSPGGRISAKAYEYLVTDRPILAAVPPGESSDYLADKPGVWLAAPDDAERMKEVVAELAAAKFAGEARAIERDGLREELSFRARAGEFEATIRDAIERRRGRRRRPFRSTRRRTPSR